MVSHELLESIPIAGAKGRRLWFVDGVRVDFARFYRIEQSAERIDSFTTERVGDRWQFRKVARRGEA